MTNPTLLDNNEHLNIRIRQGYSGGMGDNVSLVPVVPAEFSKLVAHYPIFVVKDGDSGQFMFNALLGLVNGENLYLTDDNWDADYVPLHVQRQPFSIGVQISEQGGKEVRNPMIHIDMDSPRVNTEEGETLFSEMGGQTPYLQRVNTILSELMNGASQTREIINILIENDLLESLQLKIQLDSGESITTEGLYSISQDKLANLTPEQLTSLHKSGLLELIYLVKTSLNHLSPLIARRNKRDAG